jgi:hypothetical protein
MSSRTAEELKDTPLSLVYIAGGLFSAEAAEEALTDSGIDYTVDLEPFTTTSLISGEYIGLFIYVPTLQHERCRTLLHAKGLTDTVQLDEPRLTEKSYGA